MSEYFNGNTGWREEDGEVFPPDEGVYPNSDGVQSQINGEVVKTDPEHEVHTRNSQPFSNTTPSKPYELPRDGRSNTPHFPTPQEVQEGLTDEEIDKQQKINETGADEARKALGLPPKPPKIPKGDVDEQKNRPRLF